MDLNNKHVPAPFEEGTIAWDRLAEPQSDQYDSRITLEYARQQGYVARERHGGTNCFDGEVALCQAEVAFPECFPASYDHPNIARACELIRLWPTGFHQCQLLIESVSPVLHTTMGDYGIGSMSGPGGDRFGMIAATVNNDIGFAQALVHEMAHHKLRALGVEMEAAQRILLNPPDQKFQSPIRYDCLRPMSAILHAQYSYTYVTALDVAIMRSGKEAAREREIAEVSLAVHLPKLEFGLKVIEENAAADHYGSDFLAGLFAWSHRLFAEGHALLEERGVAPVPFVYAPGGAATSALEDQISDFQQAFERERERTWTLRPRRRRGVRKVKSEEGLVFYPPQNAAGFLFNASAIAIWELCGSRRTVADIAQELGRQIDRSPEELLPDVLAAIDNLHGLGFLELKDVAGAPYSRN